MSIAGYSCGWAFFCVFGEVNCFRKKLFEVNEKVMAAAFGGWCIDIRREILCVVYQQ